MYKLTHTIRTFALLAAALLLLPIAASAAGGSSASTTPQDPQAAAKESYNRALKYRDKAWEYEAKAEAAEGADRDKLMEKADKEFSKALKSLDSAVYDAPDLYQAHSSRGYVLRKLGDYEESLAAYNRALEINPSYTEAIEYRAQAYLGLNRIAEAKEAYMELFRTDRKRADELMEAMQEWVQKRQADASDVEASVIADFSSWVDERASLATQTGDASGGSW